MNDSFDIATRKGLFQVRRTNGDWQIAQSAFVGDTITMLLRDARSDCIYAAARLGHFGVKMHRATINDDGTWGEFVEISTPAYPPKPDDAPEIKCPVRGTVVPWSLDMIWALETGAADGELWCGTIPGGLFHSTDAGATWHLVRSLWDHPDRAKWFGGGYDYPGIHSICVDPRQRTRLAVGISCGGVWVTADNGETWAQQAHGMRAAYLPPEIANEPDSQDPHRVVQCPAEPDKLWAQHHNGIFRSTDNSTSWSEIENVEPSVFGFAVAVHPQDGDTAWFIPAIKDEKRVPVGGRLVVTRTRDGGESFDTLTQGLPQQHAYDIVYRHALDIAADGNTLAFGTTTGSLFVSTDGGDHWQCISNHLPPVYALRFV